MLSSGWFRLWLALSVLFLPAGAIWYTKGDRAYLVKRNDGLYAYCNDQQMAAPTYPDAKACLRDVEADQNIYEHQHTTPLAYWTRAAIASLLMDLFATGLFIIAAVAFVWVRRGFENDSA